MSVVHGSDCVDDLRESTVTWELGRIKWACPLLALTSSNYAFNILHLTLSLLLVHAVTSLDADITPAETPLLRIMLPWGVKKSLSRRGPSRLLLMAYTMSSACRGKHSSHNESSIEENNPQFSIKHIK